MSVHVEAIEDVLAYLRYELGILDNLAKVCPPPDWDEFKKKLSIIYRNIDSFEFLEIVKNRSYNRDGFETLVRHASYRIEKESNSATPCCTH